MELHYSLNGTKLKLCSCIFLSSKQSAKTVAKMLSGYQASFKPTVMTATESPAEQKARLFRINLVCSRRGEARSPVIHKCLRPMVQCPFVVSSLQRGISTVFLRPALVGSLPSLCPLWARKAAEWSSHLAVPLKRGGKWMRGDTP